MCDQRVRGVSTFQLVKALVRKRLQYARKQWQIPLLGLALPSLIFLIQGLREGTYVYIIGWHHIFF